MSRAEIARAAVPAPSRELDVLELRRLIRSARLEPFLPLEFSVHPVARLKASVDRLVERGWIMGDFSLDVRATPIAWDEADRSARFHMHAWAPIVRQLALHGQTGDDRYLDMVLPYARDWLGRYQRPQLRRRPAEVLSAASNEQEEAFAWYDMAVGLRTPQLAYFLDVLARRDHTEADELMMLYQSVLFHLEMLSIPSFFRGHSNHGLYQALGHLSAAGRFSYLPHIAPFLPGARTNLKHAIGQQFFEDGVHKEHSPGYQHTVMNAILAGREAGLLEPSELTFLASAEEALMWMTMPEGSLAPFGDTTSALPRPQKSPKRLSASANSARKKSPLLNYFRSQPIDSPPPSGVKEYPQSGYAFARIHDGDPHGASYLAQLSAYHSRTHKHADHLTFLWSEGQLPILIDPGRFSYKGRTARGSKLFQQGFWYGDPKRIYIESTSAHNCVEIDSQSYIRTNTNAFGSALKSASHRDGLVVFDSKVQYGALNHRRVLVLAPQEFLLVLDGLYDDSARPHDFRQWFQFAPRWHVEVDRAGYKGSSEDHRLRVLDLTGRCASSPVYRGQEDPLQGWSTLGPDRLIPSPSVHFSREHANDAVFATLISLDAAAQVDMPAQPDPALSSCDFAWRTATTRFHLAIRTPDDRIAASLERQPIDRAKQRHAAPNSGNGQASAAVTKRRQLDMIDGDGPPDPEKQLKPAPFRLLSTRRSGYAGVTMPKTPQDQAGTPSSPPADADAAAKKEARKAARKEARKAARKEERRANKSGGAKKAKPSTES